MEDDAENRFPPGPGLEDLLKRGFNRGGRPRKDGVRADDRTTALGFSKRYMARCRLYASVPEDVFTAALAKHLECFRTGRRVPSIESLLRAHHKANDGYERELVADAKRIISTARRILKTTEFNADADGLRSLAETTIAVWMKVLTNE